MLPITYTLWMVRSSDELVIIGHVEYSFETPYNDGLVMHGDNYQFGQIPDTIISGYPVK